MKGSERQLKAVKGHTQTELLKRTHTEEDKARYRGGQGTEEDKARRRTEEDKAVKLHETCAKKYQKNLTSRHCNP